jgi:chromosome segregation ATPase
MDKDISIEGLREQLTDSLADWGSQLSLLLNELETQRSRVGALEASASNHDERVESQAQQLKAQADLIVALQDEVAETSDLRQQMRDAELETERVAAELDTKRELITALRRDSASTEEMKKSLRAKDKEVARLQEAQRQADQHIGALQGELSELQETSGDDASEVEALQADLEARKSLVDSLRSDIERLGPLEEQITEKQSVIVKLEASVNRQAATIAELHQTITTWRRRYSSLKGGQGSNPTTAPRLPKLTETDIRALENMPADQTMAIDMSESLEEARAASRAISK